MSSKSKLVTRIAFDTTALSHFSRAGRLDTMREITAGDECILLGEVMAELAKGVAIYPELGRIPAEPWLRPMELNELKELAAFASYKGELGGGPAKNNGEAAVLAWVSVNGGTAVIDEEVGRNMGVRDGLQVHGSLWLVIRSFKSNVLDRATAEHIVDDLVGTEMRLPVNSGADLFTWAYSSGLLP
jgi:predicted nucleic acid-binding protein